MYKSKTGSHYIKCSRCANKIALHLMIISRCLIDEMNWIETENSKVLILFCEIYYFNAIFLLFEVSFLTKMMHPVFIRFYRRASTNFYTLKMHTNMHTSCDFQWLLTTYLEYCLELYNNLGTYSIAQLASNRMS